MNELVHWLQLPLRKSIRCRCHIYQNSLWEYGVNTMYKHDSRVDSQEMSVLIAIPLCVQKKLMSCPMFIRQIKIMVCIYVKTLST